MSPFYLFSAAPLPRNRVCSEWAHDLYRAHAFLPQLFLFLLGTKLSALPPFPILEFLLQCCLHSFLRPAATDVFDGVLCFPPQRHVFCPFLLPLSCDAAFIRRRLPSHEIGAVPYCLRVEHCTSSTFSSFYFFAQRLFSSESLFVPFPSFPMVTLPPWEDQFPGRSLFSGSLVALSACLDLLTCSFSRSIFGDDAFVSDPLQRFPSPLSSRFLLQTRFQAMRSPEA